MVNQIPMKMTVRDKKHGKVRFSAFTKRGFGRIVMMYSNHKGPNGAPRNAYKVIDTYTTYGDKAQKLLASAKPNPHGKGFYVNLGRGKGVKFVSNMYTPSASNAKLPGVPRVRVRKVRTFYGKLGSELFKGIKQ